MLYPYFSQHLRTIKDPSSLPQYEATVDSYRAGGKSFRIIAELWEIERLWFQTDFTLKLGFPRLYFHSHSIDTGDTRGKGRNKAPPLTSPSAEASLNSIHRHHCNYLNIVRTPDKPHPEDNRTHKSNLARIKPFPYRQHHNEPPTAAQRSLRL